jgi:hypothetical protein
LGVVVCVVTGRWQGRCEASLRSSSTVGRIWLPSLTVEG